MTRARLAVCLAAALAALPARAQQADGMPGLTLRAFGSSDTRARGGADAELSWQASGPAQTSWRAQASAHERFGGGGRVAVNQLVLDRPLGTGYLSAGKRIVSWDVGYAFRPLDVVQQEDRRARHAAALEGVDLLAWEAFDAVRALALVLANPGRGRAASPKDDGALAARLYRRRPGRDEHALLRVSRRNGIEAGLAVALVASDGLELHASALWQRRHEKWLNPLAGGALSGAAANRWQAFAGGGKLLAGFTWNTPSKFSLLGEAWLDRTAYRAGDWARWQARNAALAAAAPNALAAANLQWQFGAIQASSLRQRNLMLRAAQSADDAELAFDTLWMPEDGGRVDTVALNWKPGPWLLELSWRRHGGKPGSVARALPARGAGALSLQRAF